MAPIRESLPLPDVLDCLVGLGSDGSFGALLIIEGAVLLRDGERLALGDRDVPLEVAAEEAGFGLKLVRVLHVVAVVVERNDLRCHS